MFQLNDNDYKRYNSFNRRKFLRSLALIGAGAAVMPVLSACSTASDLTSDYREKVRKKGREAAGQMEAIISYATLAPSGHNTQPWEYRIKGNTITIYPDYSRKLPVVDPDDREMFISLGCALENLVIAAKFAGFNAHPEYKFNNSKEESITVNFESCEPNKSMGLYDVIKKRQCTRNEYNGKPVPTADLNRIDAMEKEPGVNCVIISDKKQISRITELVKEGDMQQMNNDAFYTELQSWIRFSEGEAEETGDGLYSKCMGNPSVPRWLGKTFMNLFYGAKSQAEDDEKRILSSSGLILFTSEKNDKTSWINTGRTYERWALTTTMLNIKSAFINQPVEVTSLKKELASYMTLGSSSPQLLLRYGYSNPMPYSFRRSLKEVIV
jgi:hypothetical protein